MKQKLKNLYIEKLQTTKTLINFYLLMTLFFAYLKLQNYIREKNNINKISYIYHHDFNSNIR